ncbi:MAG: hypothetical protein KME20_26880 [Kaiparowitsia implicata GSE-PSE-MK54-09C]|jgi:hypothetical protein|nr:hypothetical protein [Kaiparowitsia implicata GSE-PSE-MK54-09C]
MAVQLPNDITILLRKPRLKWRFKDHWSGESALFDLGGVRVHVKDMDGDSTCWTIRRGKDGPVIAEGNSWEADHWDICLLQAEKALLKIVSERIAELRANASPLPNAIAEMSR